MARKTVVAVMNDLGLAQERLRFKPARPKRVERMFPTGPNQAWQIDMTTFRLSDLTTLFLVVVVDVFCRKVVGWSLDRRCRANEWLSAVRMALEPQGLTDKDDGKSLTLRSDNGAQPCSKAFSEYLGGVGIQGQFTRYNAPDDNAFADRVIRTLKEEEIWQNQYDSLSEAHLAIEPFVNFYNQERIHSALGYRSPVDVEATWSTLAAV